MRETGGWVVTMVMTTKQGKARTHAPLVVRGGALPARGRRLLALRLLVRDHEVVVYVLVGVALRFVLRRVVGVMYGVE